MGSNGFLATLLFCFFFFCLPPNPVHTGMLRGTTGCRDKTWIQLAVSPVYIMPIISGSNGATLLCAAGFPRIPGDLTGLPTALWRVKDTRKTKRRRSSQSPRHVPRLRALLNRYRYHIGWLWSLTWFYSMNVHLKNRVLWCAQMGQRSAVVKMTFRPRKKWNIGPWKISTLCGLVWPAW